VKDDDTKVEPYHLLSLNSQSVLCCSNVNYLYLQKNFCLSKSLLLYINWLHALNADFFFTRGVMHSFHTEKNAIREVFKLKNSMHIYAFVLKLDHNYVQSCSGTFTLPSEHAS